MTRPRLLRILKWAGVGVCVVWFGSFFVGCDYWISRNSVLSVWCGAIQRDEVHPAQPFSGFIFFFTDPAGGLAEFDWLPTTHYWGGTGANTVVIPLWPLLVPFAAWALVSYWMRRRPRSGHCRCGYSLEGNVSGVCPECGAEALT